MDVLVISAPRLYIFGKLHNNNFPRFHSSTSTVQVWALCILSSICIHACMIHVLILNMLLTQGSNIIASMTAVVSSVKVLAISNMKLRLNVVINLMKCFPHLEKLYIQVTFVPECAHAFFLKIRLPGIRLISKERVAILQAREAQPHAADRRMRFSE